MFVKRSGFTLIELMLTVAIIGILAAIVTPNVVTQIERAKFTKTAALIQTLEVALETYKIDYKRYPPSMYNQNPRKAIDPSQFYKIIGERAKSAVSVKGKDLKALYFLLKLEGKKGGEGHS